jgi:hypothetical protein
MEERKIERESKRERVRECERGEVSPEWVPKAGIPGLGCHLMRMPNQLDRSPGGMPQVGVQSMPGAAPVTSKSSGSSKKGNTLTSLRRGVSQGESSRRERLMMYGIDSKAVRSEIHSLEAHGVNSAVWVWDRAGHDSQGSSPRPEQPVNLSLVLAPNIRNC